jgi:hypothetical protein
MRLMRAFILVVGIIAIAVAVHVENLAALYAAVVGGILIEVTFEAFKTLHTIDSKLDRLLGDR